MENIEQNKDIIPKQEDLGKQQDNRLNFLNDEKFFDIKEPLNKTINNLADEHIITPEEEFRKNIEQVTKDIFSDPLFEFDVIAKENQANNIFLFRTKFEEIKKENLKNIEEEQTEIKEEEAEQEEEKNIEFISDKSKYYERLMKMYEETESTYKIQDENLPNYKNTYLSGLSEESKNNFQALLTEQQDGYLKARYAAEKIAEEAKKGEKKEISREHYSFIKQFNALDDELKLDSKIDISELRVERKRPEDSIATMNDIISKDRIGEELVARNKDLGKFVETGNNMLSKKEKELMFPLEDIKSKVIERYPEKIENTLNELLQENNLTQYQESFNPDGSLRDVDTIDEKDAKKLKKISEKMDDEITAIALEEQENMISETEKTIKTKAIETLFKAIGQHFQTISGKENLAEQFSLDIENGVTFDENMLKISGDTDGREIGFYYDIKNGKIRADDFIHFEEGNKNTKEEGIYYIDRDEDSKGREELPIHNMKTLEQTMNESKSETINNITESIKDSERPGEYQMQLSDKTQIAYEQESSVAEITIKQRMEKNMAVQELHDFITAYMPERDAYSMQGQKFEYNLYRIIDTSFDRYRADEIQQRNNLFQRFQSKINQERPSFNDDLISSLFDEETAKLQQEGEYDLEKGPNIYQFFQGITHENGNIIKEQVIDLTFFEKIVNELEQENGNTKKLKGESKKYEKLRNDFEESKIQNTADNDLHLEDPILRGNSTQQKQQSPAVKMSEKLKTKN